MDRAHQDCMKTKEAIPSGKDRVKEGGKRNFSAEESAWWAT